MIEVQQLAREFQGPLHTTKRVVEITAMFRERELIAPQYVVAEEMKKDRYHEMLRSDIRQLLIRSSCNTLEDMIVMAMESEIDL